MQEYGWLHWNDLGDMVQVVEERATARQKRLFVCACVRRLWPLLQDERSRTAVEVAELFVDHQASKQQLKAARRAAATAIAEARSEVLGELYPSHTQQQLHEDEWMMHVRVDRSPRLQAAMAAERVADPSLFSRYSWVSDISIQAATATGMTARREEETAQCHLFRDIFGNPFRPVAFDPPWQTSTAVGLARTMYESRDFAAMPILADALEEAGCDNPDVLSHCRGPGPHVRGCWVVDLVLGKS
jgi:hypothetical protein